MSDNDPTTRMGSNHMKRTFAASLISTLLYAQALLAFAGVASVLLKDQAPASIELAASDDAPSVLR